MTLTTMMNWSLMIRFIDIRGQGTGDRFAFYNTINYDFFSCDRIQSWSNWDEFADDYDLAELYDIERFKSLCPEWAFNDDEDEL